MDFLKPGFNALREGEREALGFGSVNDIREHFRQQRCSASAGFVTASDRRART
jgi:hypothetical protein